MQRSIGIANKVGRALRWAHRVGRSGRAQWHGGHYDKRVAAVDILGFEPGVGHRAARGVGIELDLLSGMALSRIVLAAPTMANRFPLLFHQTEDRVSDVADTKYSIN
jgi:hypothetical protein